MTEPQPLRGHIGPQPLDEGSSRIVARPSTTIAPFSLFDGDFVNRWFAWLGWHSRRTADIAKRCLFVAVVTWVPMAVLALVQHLVSRAIDARNFFADYAAYAQFLIALPLFVVGERIVSRSTREAAETFVDTGVVEAADVPLADAAHREVSRLGRSHLAEWCCIVLAYTLAAATILPERWAPSMHTWHMGAAAVPQTAIRALLGVRTVWGLTLPGVWALMVALPLLNYWWLRIAWKVIVWTRYLSRISRPRLVLVASHPDQTGGIGFVSEVQATFALIIFAYGISNVAAVIAYKVAIEKAPLSLPPVWGPAIGFIIVAPALFTAPLLMFTKQLSRTKHRALAAYREQIMRQSLAFESSWLAADASDAKSATVLGNMNQLTTLFHRIEDMRIVPFDLKSGVQLIGSTLGSVATALPLLKFEATLKDWLEFLSALLKHGG